MFLWSNIIDSPQSITLATAVIHSHHHSLTMASSVGIRLELKLLCESLWVDQTLYSALCFVPLLTETWIYAHNPFLKSLPVSSCSLSGQTLFLAGMVPGHLFLLPVLPSFWRRRGTVALQVLWALARVQFFILYLHQITWSRNTNTNLWSESFLCSEELLQKPTRVLASWRPCEERIKKRNQNFKLPSLTRGVSYWTFALGF